MPHSRYLLSFAVNREWLLCCINWLLRFADQWRLIPRDLSLLLTCLFILNTIRSWTSVFYHFIWKSLGLLRLFNKWFTFCPSAMFLSSPSSLWVRWISHHLDVLIECSRMNILILESIWMWNFKILAELWLLYDLNAVTTHRSWMPLIILIIVILILKLVKSSQWLCSIIWTRSALV